MIKISIFLVPQKLTFFITERDLNLAMAIITNLKDAQTTIIVGIKWPKPFKKADYLLRVIKKKFSKINLAFLVNSDDEYMIFFAFHVRKKKAKKIKKDIIKTFQQIRKEQANIFNIED